MLKRNPPSAFFQQSLSRGPATFFRQRNVRAKTAPAFNSMKNLETVLAAKLRLAKGMLPDCLEIAVPAKRL